MQNLFRRFFIQQATSLTRTAWLVASASVASRALGVFRDRVLASEFGAGDTLDVYYAAFRFPDLIYNLVIVGALSAGFIPVFMAAKEKGKNEHWRIAGVFASAIALTLFFMAVLLAVTAPYLVPILAPGFSDEKQQVVISLTRILCFSPLLLGMSAVAGAVLQSFQRFFLFSIAPIFYNLGIICGALFLAPRYGIRGVAWGVVIGAILHSLLQFFGAWQLGWRPRFTVRFYGTGISEITRLMAPRVVAASTQQLNVFLLTIIASTLSAGSLAVLTFSTNLYFLPVALFGISYGVAAFPKLTQSAIAGNTNDFVTIFSSAVRQISFFLIPATVLTYVLREHIVRIILGAGAFDWTATRLTSSTLGWMTLSLIFGALIPLLVRGFYAHRNALLPLYVGLTADVVTVIAAYALSRVYGIVGLGMALSIGTAIQFFGLWIGLKHVVKFSKLNIFGSIMRQVVAGFGMACGVIGFLYVFTPLVDETKFTGLVTAAVLTMFAGVSIYLILLWFLREPTVRELIAAFRSRLTVTTAIDSMEESKVT
ncbi:MAG: murein biosynthesis integral membrane protein MurJ [Patescibacteria group bacterium]